MHSPTQICYLVDCIEQGEEIGTVPTVDVEGGRLICVHVDYTCVVPVDVPDI